VLSVFAGPERGEFLRLLDKFNRAFNDSTRVPLLAERPDDPPKARRR
jgi:hypothetical protein